MIRHTANLLAGLGVACAVLAAPGAPAAADSVTIATPGIPPIFSVMIAYVAEKEGFFKKHGVDVTIRPFDNGTAAARAVVAGDVDMSYSPTPPVINQVSNAGVPLVAVYGMPNPDWVLGTIEKGKKCQDLKGQEVGVDSIGGARSVALRSMLTGCSGVTINDVKQVPLGAGTGAAMIAGKLNFGVLHLDDLAELKVQGKPVDILLRQKETSPNSHYLMLVVRKDNLAKKRDAVVRTVAGLIESAQFMADPKNADAVAKIATVTGHSEAVDKEALKEFLAINFWAVHDDGLPKDKIEATAHLMKKIGAIKPDKEPVTYAQLVDPSVWKDANAMVK